MKVFVSKFAIIDSLKLVEDRYLITAGIDPKVRFWNIESEKVISKFQIHTYSTVFMVCHKEYIFSYGYDMNLSKYNFKSKALENTVAMDGKMTALKLLKTPNEETMKHKLVASLITGEILLFDLNLK